MNMVHETGCALHIMRNCNQTIMVDNFSGDEYVGTERKYLLKETMATSVKEVHKLTAYAQSIV